MSSVCRFAAKLKFSKLQAPLDAGMAENDDLETFSEQKKPAEQLGIA